MGSTISEVGDTNRSCYFYSPFGGNVPLPHWRYSQGKGLLPRLPQHLLHIACAVVENLKSRKMMLATRRPSPNHVMIHTHLGSSPAPSSDLMRRSAAQCSTGAAAAIPANMEKIKEESMMEEIILASDLVGRPLVLRGCLFITLYSCNG
jgi:hypothetical protein